MFRFQLEVAIALVASAFSSLVIRYFTGNKAEGAIQLPVHVEGDHHDTLHDPFDVTRPEDVVHGYPIDAEGFWTSIRRRKLLISSLLALAVAISSILLGWSVADELWEESTVYSLHLVFALYVLFLGARSVRQEDAYFHKDSIIHLSTLSTLGFLLLGGTVILPESPPPFTSSNLAYKILWRRSTHEVSIQDSDVFLRALWYILVLIHTFTWILIIRTPLGPLLHYPASNIYSEKTVTYITNKDENNVCGIISGSPWDLLLFSYTTKIIWLGNTAESLEIGDLPILPADMRSVFNYDLMRRAMRTVSLRFFSWNPKPGSGWQLSWQLVRLNYLALTAEALIAALSAVLFYTPAYFLRHFVAYLEVNPGREEKAWGWVYVIGLFVTNAIIFLMTGQLWSLASTTVQCRLRIQLNSTLFAKILVRKDVASSAPQTTKGGKNESESGADSVNKGDGNDFSTKAQIMTLMTTDVDRVSDFSWHLFSLVDAPIEALIGALFLYDLLGVSCFFGLAAILPFIPLNHLAGKVVMGAQVKLMKARDERISLMNEILGAIRMVKFMAWERSYEKRVLAIRKKELKYQQRNFAIETLWSAIWNGSPVLITLISFWHFTIVRQQSLTPSIAFTSILVFSEMKYALSALPETFINMLQSFVSLRRIEKYFNAEEVNPVPPLDQQSKIMAFQSCTITWPQERASTRQVSSASSTPQQKFRLVDLNLDFPRGGLSLVCGKLGSGKTLLLLALLGEAEVLAGQVLCPRSPPDSLASFVSVIPSQEDWVVEGLCAYVPQAAWLRNASIKENILFNLPYDEERYAKTLEVCALITDLEILEDGDESEIGERGVNLSGGQKARVSLARAVYSRASILLLDDVLSAVDAHTADHIYNECLKGKLMEGRTVILVSHHVRMCAPDASYIVTLDNGRVQFHGSQDDFHKSGIIRTLTQSTQHEEKSDKAENSSEESAEKQTSVVEREERSESGSTVVASVKQDKKPARKLVEEERRAVGRISRDIWENYFAACGQLWYWVIFAVVFFLGSLSPVVENGWLRHWSNSELNGTVENPGYYISVYAILTAIGLVIGTIRWFIMYRGSIQASHILYRRLLESVLFAKIRFHDTISRGRLLNRFGKDFEGIDSSLSDNLGRSFTHALSAATTIITVSVVGGLPFISITAILGIVYWNVAKIYGQTSRDMRRLDSVTRSPLYSIYGETISGVTLLRAFGASSKFLRDMLRHVDTHSNPYYWEWGVNRWLAVRFNLLSAGIVGATGVACLITPGVSASLAGFALAFASTITMDLMFMVRRFVGLEQSMVAVERVKEYTELKREPPEFMEPRPDPSWPSHGEIKCENLVIRYAPELPDVLHHVNFEVRPGEKVGILGRTGSGKSTLALSFFRFVEATEGRILIDGIDISTIGLADLRSHLTIIPQDPIILSGTLRSTLDVFDEYQDAEIYEALRRVHLIPSDDTPSGSEVSLNVNVFRDLDSTISESGDNLSTGEKQLLCMARAILKRSKVLVMDEATASVDYATDELIGRTIRHEFAESTILTIAHRLRTVIDYDRVLVLEQGRIVEFDKPSTLLSDPSSKFSALCKATGRHEYATLKQLAGVSDQL